MKFRPLASFAALALAACSNGGSDSTPAATITSAPQIQANPNTWVPLVPVIHVETDKPTRIRLKITDDAAPTDVRELDDDGGYATVHARVPVMGLRPARSYSIVVSAIDQSGRVTQFATPLQFTTGALPTYFPPISLATAVPGRMQAGVTVVNAATTNHSAGRHDLLLALDNQGQVCWYLDGSLLPQTSLQAQFQQTPTFIATDLPNGHYLLIVDKHGLVEVDKVGDVHGAWWASNVEAPPTNGGAFTYTPVATDSFHHDVVPMPAGAGFDFAALGTEVRQYPNYPTSVVNTSQTATAPTNVVGDTIVEFRRDGTVVREIKLLDLLDPYRVVYDSLVPFWNSHYGFRPTADWSHGNGMFYDPASDAYVASLRHQDALVKIARGTGQVSWILGAPERWTAQWQPLLLAPMPGTEWMYHQHAPEIEADGRILVFDNGNERSTPPTPGIPLLSRYSRAVEFQVNDRQRVVEQTWAFTSANGSMPINSYFVGDANRLGNGNVLVCDGGKGDPNDANRYTYGRVVEVATAPQDEVVFDVTLRDRAATSPAAWFCYRAFRKTGFGR